MDAALPPYHDWPVELLDGSGEDMDSAVWGALGATVGAGLTALAAYLGPMRAARAAERQQAEERREQQANGAVERLIAIRSTYRDWEIYLQETSMSFRARQESVATVKERIGALRSAAKTASDAAMRDGWWIGSEVRAFEVASAQVMALVAGATTVMPPWVLAEVREMRSALNEGILERLAAVLDDGAVLRQATGAGATGALLPPPPQPRR